MLSWKGMTTLEKTELACIPAVGAGCWALAGSSFVPAAAVVGGSGGVLLTLSALLLLQGLVRDLCLLLARRRTATATAGQRLRCMCVESTVGVAGVAAGLILLGAGWDHRLASLPAWAWGALATGTLVVGFLVKDLVVQWSPWRIRRETDHLGIVFTWQK